MKPPLILSLLFSSFVVSLGAADRLAPSAQPPVGLKPAQVPQFVSIGFDDNPDADPIHWLVDLLADKKNPAGSGQAATFDGTPVRVGFFSNGTYWKKPDLVAAHRRAFAAGHEIDNHTLTHANGGKFSVDDWRKEVAANDEVFVLNGIPKAAILGIRAPYLAYNAAMFEVSVNQGRLYDTSIEEGWQPDQDGTNYLWPYTLDDGSPGDAVPYVGRQGSRIASYPGLWEIAVHAFRVPSDDECARYGVTPGLRERIRDHMLKKFNYQWDPALGKITGLDWNCLEQAGLSGPEFFAILKFTLDLRLAGNRAPLMICGHSALYPASKPDRRQALADFVAYALSKPEVRFVPGAKVIEWLRHPLPLK